MSDFPLPTPLKLQDLETVKKDHSNGRPFALVSRGTLQYIVDRFQTQQRFTLGDGFIRWDTSRHCRCHPHAESPIWLLASAAVPDGVIRFVDFPDDWGVLTPVH